MNKLNERKPLKRHVRIKNNKPIKKLELIDTQKITTITNYNYLNMKVLKQIFKIVLVLIGLLVAASITILGVDAQRTSYLNINKSQASNNNTYLITNVNIIPMTKDTVLLDKTVFIQNGIIKEIADSIEIQGVEAFDAKNKFLTPGLIDMHVHVWDEYELGLYLSNGVTAVRNLWGMPMHLRMKEAIKNEKIFAPEFYTSGPKLTGPEFIGDDNLQLYSPKEAREKVQSYKSRGYDFIKTYYGLTKELYDEVIKQAKISDMDIVAHPSQKVPFAYHFNSQIKSMEHAEDIVQEALNYKLDSIKLNKIVEEYADSPNTSFCPTLISFYNIYNMLTNENILESESAHLMNALIRTTDSKKQFERWGSTKKEDSTITERIKNQHDFHLYILKKLHDAGVNIICGTDSGIGVTAPGMAIHQELLFYKEAGLSNYEVLKTATINAAKVHKIMSHMGTIEEGKTANLLLLNNNPLTNLDALQKPNTVFIRGRKLNRETLDNFDAQAKDRKNLIPTAFRYAEYMWIEK